MRILGIDPGTSRMGWGIVESPRGSLEAGEYGVIILPPEEEFPRKIELAVSGVSGLIEKYGPEEISIEEPFLAGNARVLLRMGQVAGAVMAASAVLGRKTSAYSVLEVKQSVAGYGRADKRQVQEMVRILLGMDEIPSPADAADALAAAICRHNMAR